MSDSTDSSWHDLTRSELAGLALGEPLDPAVSAHVADCPDCAAALADYRRIVQLARESDDRDDPGDPPAAVWERIESAVRPRVGSPAPVRGSVRLRIGLVAAAAVVAVAGAGVLGWAIGRGSDDGRGTTARAALQAQAGTRAEAHGSASMHTTDDGYQLAVQVHRLPPPEGFYEVWLYNPSSGRMVAIGALGTGGRGTFTVPGGLDLRAYHVVDVSAEKYDGNPAHARSVLRGPLSN